MKWVRLAIKIPFLVLISPVILVWCVMDVIWWAFTNSKPPGGGWVIEFYLRSFKP
jgi:hypothetical protein